MAGGGFVRVTHIGTIVVVGAVLLTVFQNCGTPAGSMSSAEPDRTKQQLLSLKEFTESLNSDLSCTRDSDCESIGYGSRACGGPEGYWIVSHQNPNFEQIEALAQEHRSKAQELNRAMNAIGTCEFIVPPESHCQAGLCQPL
jgi:hypothetical protein